jgi:hypothetical protein
MNLTYVDLFWLDIIWWLSRIVHAFFFLRSSNMQPRRVDSHATVNDQTAHLRLEKDLWHLLSVAASHLSVKDREGKKFSKKDKGYSKETLYLDVPWPWKNGRKVQGRLEDQALSSIHCFGQGFSGFVDENVRTTTGYRKKTTPSTAWNTQTVVII